MQTDAIGDRLRTPAWVAASTGAVLGGSLLLASVSTPVLAAAARDAGLSAGMATRLALTLTALVTPAVFAVLQTRASSDRGLPALLGGLALTGASVGALWLIGFPETTAAVPAPIVATYAVGLGAIVLGYVLAQFGVYRSPSPADVRTGPSYVRDDGDPELPADGGEPEDELAFPVDDERE